MSTKEDFFRYFEETYREKLEGHPIFAERYQGFHAVFTELLRVKTRGFTIIETGTLRKRDQWTDGQSSLLFFEFLRFFGGELISIDSDASALSECGDVLAERVGFEHATFTPIQGDSVVVLEGMQKSADLLYLDSFDFSEMDPLPSMFHHFAELASLAHIRAKSPSLIVAVDDNYKNGLGKGKFIQQWVRQTNKRVIHDGLQFIFYAS